MAKKEITGYTTLIDANGQIHNMEYKERHYDRMDKKGWRRVVIKDLFNLISIIGNKKIEVLNFLIANADGNNQINFTQDEVSFSTGISKQIVNETFKTLVEEGFLKKIKRQYVINTQIISAFGRTEKNQILCVEYGFYEDGATKENATDEEKLSILEKQMKYYQQKINKKVSNKNYEPKNENKTINNTNQKGEQQ